MLYLEVSSRIHSGPILASVLLHIFINGLKEATEATLIKLARHQIGAVLRGAVNPLDSRAAIQRDLQRLKEKPNRNVVKSTKDQDQVPLLGGKKPWQ